MEEYSRRQAHSARGSSSHSLRAVKRELEAEPERRGGGVIGPRRTSAIIRRSAREEEEVEQRHRREADLDAALLEQGLVKTHEFDDNQEAWHREAKAQDDIYVPVPPHPDGSGIINDQGSFCTVQASSPS